jgi:aspartokinase/homoserine dehydrogenase 1
MIVLKFGGSSVADAKRIKRIADIIDAYKLHDKIAVVVSALKGVTNGLDEAGAKAVHGDREYIVILKEIENRHFEMINELLTPENRAETAANIKMLCNEAGEVCRGITLLGECSDRSRAKLLSIGVRMSSGVISSALKCLGHPNQLVNSLDIISTDSNYLAAHINHGTSKKKAEIVFAQVNGLSVLLGFIASSDKGEVTTLGRGGSDFTAALLANYLNAERLDIWTDVNGVLTALPDIVSSAYTIPAMSYEEAMELFLANRFVLVKRWLRSAIKGSPNPTLQLI